MATKYPGKCSLKLSILSAFEDRAIQLEMLSRKYSVDLNDDLMNELNSIEEMEVKVVV